MRGLDGAGVPEGLMRVAKICLKGFDLCVLKHHIVNRSGIKIDPEDPELLLCAGIMLGCVDLYAAITWVAARGRTITKPNTPINIQRGGL